MDAKCMVVALFHGANWKTGFCRVGDQCWTTISVVDEMFNPPWSIIDFHYNNGFFYEILSTGHVNVFDTNDNSYKCIRSSLDTNPSDVYILIVEGCSEEHGFLVFSCEYVHYPFDEKLHMCSFYKFSTQNHNWSGVEPDALRNFIFFLGGVFHCLALPAANVQLDGLEGNQLCYLKSEDRHADWTCCNINLCKLDDRSITKLASPLSFDPTFFVIDALDPCYLWHTPTIC
jgi:hypothetical protein